MLNGKQLWQSFIKMEILKRTQHKQNIVREIPIFIPITQTFWEIERRILFFFGYKILKAQQKKRQTDEEK